MSSTKKKDGTKKASTKKEANYIQASKEERSRVLLLIFAFCIIVSSILFVCKKRGIPYLPPSPYYQIAMTARSIWEQGTIVRADFAKSFAELRALSAEKPEFNFHQDIFVQGDDGTLYPKHPLLASALAVPFYAVFGTKGFWIMNQCILLLIFASLYYIAKQLSDRDTAFRYIIVTACTSQFLLTSYSLSYDLMAAALVLFGCATFSRQPLLGALISALAVHIRATNILFLPFMAIAWLPFREKKSQINFLIQSFIGFTLALLPLLLINWQLWGNPLNLSYHKAVIFHAGQAVPEESHFLGLSVLFGNWHEKLFAPSTGIFRYNPILILSIFGLWNFGLWKFEFFKLKDSAKKQTLLILGSAALLNCLVVFSYSQWEQTSLGNRYLAPAIGLLSLFSLSLFASFKLKSRGKAAEAE